MHIGVITLGAVEKVGVAAVKTKFLLIGMPIAPLSSYYCVAPSADGGDQGMDIPLHPTSILMGYLRTWAGAAAALLALGAFMGPKSKFLLFLFAAVGLGTLWSLAMFKWGRLSEDELRRRRILQAHTGLGIDPKRLHVFDAHKIYKSLREQWTEQTGLRDWRGSIDKARGSQAGFLYALAAYKAASDLDHPEAVEHERQAWARVAQMSAGDMEHLEVQQIVAQLAAIGGEMPQTDLLPEERSRTERDTRAEQRERERSRRERERRERREPSDRIERPVTRKRTPRARILRESSRGLEVQCPSCAKAMKVPHAMAGKKGRCSRCKGKLRIPRLEPVNA